jgi:DNA repair exonuclease SbcCD nuclease subunit
MNNQILLYADIHHGITIGKLGSSGLDLRIEDTLEIERQITEYCLKNNIKTVIFAGDRFKSRNPDMWLVNLVDELWSRRSLKGIETYALLGNHDTYKIVSHKSNYSRLWGYSENVRIFSKPDLTYEWRGEDDDCISIGFLPYSCELESLKEKVDLLIFHGCVKGFKDTRGYIPTDEGFELDGLREKCRFFVAGHMHSFEDIQGYGIYLGAPYQIDMLDAGSKRGWVVLDIENFNYEFVESFAPELVVIDNIKDIQKINENQVKGNYMFCKVEKGIEKDCKRILEEYGARTFRVTAIKEKGIFLKGIAEDVFSGEDIDKMIVEYVTSRNLSNKNKIIDVGKQIWKESV